MNLQEAIIKAKETDNWFRPVGMFCQAYYVRPDSMILTVPSPEGGYIGITALVENLLGDWEIVDPDFVCEEIEILRDNRANALLNQT